MTSARSQRIVDRRSWIMEANEFPPPSSQRLPGICQILHFSEVESTQTLAKSLAEKNAPEGTLVWADRQTAGRGRMSRRWRSPPGGLYFSLILRPSFSPTRLAEAGLAAATAVARALSRKTGIRAFIKPPNDVYALAGSRKKKLSGILAEASGGQKTLDWLVLGIGVNVNGRFPHARAASLEQSTSRPWPVPEMLSVVLQELRRAGLFSS